MKRSGRVGREDRRTFLKRLAAVGAGGAAMSLVACKQRTQEIPENVSAAIEPLTRPLLLPWSGDIIRIASSRPVLPVAYVSMATHRVFIDRAFRDRASWLLNAHISVSTALWRIPLAGDPVGEPVTPGDPLREFEEISIRDWDPATAPAHDDIRIRRGMRGTQSVDFTCVQGSGSVTRAGSEVWYSGGPWTMDVSDGRSPDSTREDFRLVGAGRRHRTSECRGEGDQVQYITWACR